MLKNKDGVFLKFKQWKNLIENIIGKKIKRLRTNNRMKYCNHEFVEFCKDYGIEA